MLKGTLNLPYTIYVRILDQQHAVCSPHFQPMFELRKLSFALTSPQNEVNPSSVITQVRRTIRKRQFDSQPVPITQRQLKFDSTVRRKQLIRELKFDPTSQFSKSGQSNSSIAAVRCNLTETIVSTTIRWEEP
ncbi:hypothetical protein DINM_002525 [Dirofilaria immitis]|nr:hypothetical protein [Dirofilaria immitis]